MRASRPKTGRAFGQEEESVLRAWQERTCLADYHLNRRLRLFFKFSFAEFYCELYNKIVYKFNSADCWVGKKQKNGWHFGAASRIIFRQIDVNFGGVAYVTDWARVAHIVYVSAISNEGCWRFGDWLCRLNIDWVIVLSLVGTLLPRLVKSCSLSGDVGAAWSTESCLQGAELGSSLSRWYLHRLPLVRRWIRVSTLARDPWTGIVQWWRQLVIGIDLLDVLVWNVWIDRSARIVISTSAWQLIRWVCSIVDWSSDSRIEVQILEIRYHLGNSLFSFGWTVSIHYCVWRIVVIYRLSSYCIDNLPS